MVLLICWTRAAFAAVCTLDTSNGINFVGDTNTIVYAQTTITVTCDTDSTPVSIKGNNAFISVTIGGQTTGTPRVGFFSDSAYTLNIFNKAIAVTTGLANTPTTAPLYGRLGNGANATNPVTLIGTVAGTYGITITF